MYSMVMPLLRTDGVAETCDPEKEDVPEKADAGEATATTSAQVVMAVNDFIVSMGSSKVRICVSKMRMAYQ
jgi:hypothetical protein